jgi:hypothetical protein
VIAALLPATAAAAVQPPTSSRKFDGRTAQHIAVSLGPLHSGLRAFHYQAKLKCSDGSTFTDDQFTDYVRAAAGHFAARVRTSRGAVVTKVTGSIAGLRASGTIRIVERYSEIPNAGGDTPLSANGAIVCDSGTVRWTATANH